MLKCIIIILMLPTMLFANCNVANLHANFTPPAKRIISLAPNLTELLFTIGAGKQVIATDTGSDYPASVKRLPKVANARDLDIEAILNLHPDLIVAWRGGNPEVQLQKLRQFGVPIYETTALRLSAIPKILHALGCLTGHVKKANQKAERFSKVLQHLKQKNAHLKPISVFYILNNQPLMTLTQDNLINDMIGYCGGRNIFANSYGLAPEVSMEAVLAKKPEVIIASEQGWQKKWQSWPEIPAVRHNNMFTISPDLILRGDYRSLKGLSYVCHDLTVARQAASM